MKVIRTIIIVFITLAVFACNNKRNNRTEDELPDDKKLPTDQPIVKKADKHKEIVFKSCKQLATVILTSSPRYKQLTKGLNEAVVKNGGLSFGVNLEASPNPKSDTVCCYSGNYDFSVYESYPDRQLSTARFSFNPNNKQLYEYDAIEDQLKPIEFDRSLLEKYKSLCK